MRRTFIAIAALCFLSAPANATDFCKKPPFPATPFTAPVTRIHDGDTFYVTTPDHLEVKVRLHSCESPEIETSQWPTQPGGIDARNVLQRLILRKSVLVIPTGKWSYCRPVVDVHIGFIDICASMLAQGMAMLDPEFVDNPALYDIQRRAIIEDRGIWSGQPIEPWRWRRMAH